MVRRGLIFCLAGISLMMPTQVSARSNAAQYLINQEIAAGCDGRTGYFDAGGIFETDLNGDGRDDLVLAHQGISCDGKPGYSLECGTQVCSIKVYVREGTLLQPKGEFLGRIRQFRLDPEPVFEIMGHGGPVSTWRPRDRL